MGRSDSRQPDVQTILETAIAFRRAADTLLESAAKTALGEVPQLPQLAPGFALSAFSVELALKALLLVETGKYQRLHKLGELFAKLDSNSQTALGDLFLVECDANPLLRQMRQEVDKVGGRMPVDIVSVLADVDDAFVSWRYVFEGDLPSVYGLQESFVAIMKRLDQLL